MIVNCFSCSGSGLHSARRYLSDCSESIFCASVRDVNRVGESRLSLSFGGLPYCRWCSWLPSFAFLISKDRLLPKYALAAVVSPPGLCCLSEQSWGLEVLVAQLCPTLCYPVDCSPPDSSVHGTLQARILEWVAIPFSRVSSQPRD